MIIYTLSKEDFDKTNKAMCSKIENKSLTKRRKKHQLLGN
jgi:hypothetical protein